MNSILNDPANSGSCRLGALKRSLSMAGPDPYLGVGHWHVMDDLAP